MEGFLSTPFDSDRQYQNRVIGPSNSPRIVQRFAYTTMWVPPDDAAKVERHYLIW